MKTLRFNSLVIQFGFSLVHFGKRVWSSEQHYKSFSLASLDLRHGSLSAESRESEDTTEAIKTVLGLTGDKGPTVWRSLLRPWPIWYAKQWKMARWYIRTEVIRGGILYQHESLNVNKPTWENCSLHYHIWNSSHYNSGVTSQACQIGYLCTLVTWWFMSLLNLDLYIVYIYILLNSLHALCLPSSNNTSKADYARFFTWPVFVSNLSPCHRVVKEPLIHCAIWWTSFLLGEC